MDRWKAFQWTARVCVILLIVTACFCFIGWSLAMPDCGHDPGRCYKIEMGSLADWANAVFTLFAFVAAGLGAYYAYNANKQSAMQAELNLLLQLAGPIFKSADSLLESITINKDMQDGVNEYFKLSVMLKNLGELRARFSLVAPSLVESIAVANVSHFFLRELGGFVYLKQLFWRRNEVLVVDLRRRGLSLEDCNFMKDEFYAITKNIEVYLRSFDCNFRKREFDRVVHSAAESIEVVSRRKA